MSPNLPDDCGGDVSNIRWSTQPLQFISFLLLAISCSAFGQSDQSFLQFVRKLPKECADLRCASSPYRSQELLPFTPTSSLVERAQTTIHSHIREKWPDTVLEQDIVLAATNSNNPFDLPIKVEAAEEIRNSFSQTVGYRIWFSVAVRRENYESGRFYESLFCDDDLRFCISDPFRRGFFYPTDTK